MEEKKKKGSWEPQSLQTAIDKFMSKEPSVRQATMQYNIPKSTIHDKIKALYRGEEVTMKLKLGRFTSTFSAEYEQVLVDHIKDKKKEIKSKFEVAMGGKGKQTKGKSVDKGKEATNVKPKGKKGTEVEPLTETSNTNMTICVVCLEDTDEDWIQCSSCRGWVHEACADIPESGDGYICDRCRFF